MHCGRGIAGIDLIIPVIVKPETHDQVLLFCFALVFCVLHKVSLIINYCSYQKL